MASEQAFAEKRRHERLDYDAEVELVFAGGERCSGRVVNISMGGAFLKASSVPEFGSRIHININLPRIDGLCEIPSFVRWIKKDEGIGVQFWHLRAKETWAINKLLHDLKDQNPKS